MPEILSYSQALRYNRHIVLPQIDLQGQEVLLNARILVIGVGGLGCQAAQILCGSGVGHITLVDDDTVEASNLPRQLLFKAAQTGQKKVYAARDSLHQLNPDCQISVIAKRLDADELSRQGHSHDIVLDCTDNLHSRLLINQACYISQTPLVSAAAIRFEGQLMVVAPAQQSACYQCVSRLFNEVQLSCNEAGIFAPVVITLGSQQAQVAMLWLMGHQSLAPGQLLTYDGLTLNWQSFMVPQDPDCPVCQSSSIK